MSSARDFCVNSTEKRSSETGSFGAGPQISRLLWNPKTRYRFPYPGPGELIPRPHILFNISVVSFHLCQALAICHLPSYFSYESCTRLSHAYTLRGRAHLLLFDLITVCLRCSAGDLISGDSGSVHDRGRVN
jgi:hypothetical protein